MKYEIRRKQGLKAPLGTKNETLLNVKLVKNNKIGEYSIAEGNWQRNACLYIVK